MIAEKPKRAVWWVAQEGTINNPGIANGDYFRKDRPSYEQMLKFANDQMDMFDENEESIACFCGD